MDILSRGGARHPLDPYRAGRLSRTARITGKNSDVPKTQVARFVGSGCLWLDPVSERIRVCLFIDLNSKSYPHRDGV